MTEYKGISVFCNMGYQVPDLYLTSLTKWQSNVYGHVVRRNSETQDLCINTIKQGATFDHLKKINKAIEGQRIIHFFGSYPAGYLDDSIQPFRLLTNSAKHCVVAATLVGDFKKHLPANEVSKHSPEFWCANGKLLPRLQQVWRLCKEDSNLFHEELKMMEKEIKELIGLQGGMITLVLAKPDDTVIMNFGKSIPTFKKFSWGDTTDVLDYVTGVEVPPAAEAATKAASVPAVKSKKKKIVLTDEPAEEDDKPVETYDEEAAKRVASVEISPHKNKEPAKPVETKSGDSAPIMTLKQPVLPKDKEVVLSSGAVVRRTEVDRKEVLLYYPPIHMTKRKALRKAYKVACGRDLTNAQIDARQGVVMTNMELLKEVSKSFSDLQVLGVPTGSDAPREQKPATSPATKTEPVPDKKTDVEPQKTSVHEERKHPEGGTPIYSSMSPKTKYDVLKYLKALDKNGQSIINPLLDQELEDTTEQFYAEIGYPGLEQTLGWKFDTRAKLAKEAPEAMAIWAGDLIRLILNQQREIQALTIDPALKSSDESQELTVRKRKRA